MPKITEQRIPKFLDLLNNILCYVKSGLSVRDACICAFFDTAQRYSIKEQSVRAMVGRDCNVKNIQDFHKYITEVFLGNPTYFKVVYYNCIPTQYKNSVESIINKMIQLNIKPPKDSPEPYCEYIKGFAKLPETAKRDLLANLRKIV